MSIHAGAVINAIPGIEEKTYAELGLGIHGAFPIRAALPNGMPIHILDAAHGSTWVQVRAKRKYGVDTVWGPFVTHRMTTGEFFALPDLPKFDVIFVDANHMWEHVLEDYNNAVRALAPGGIILAHDLVPPDFAHTDAGKCGDGFKVLWGLHYAGIEHWTLNEDMGLTVFPKPEVLEPQRWIVGASWADFMPTIMPHLVPLTELQRRVISLNV